MSLRAYIAARVSRIRCSRSVVSRIESSIRYASCVRGDQAMHVAGGLFR